jgi:hypothetical protein
MSPQTKYHYFVDAQKYDTDKASLTGAEIKARIPNFNPAFQLYLENPGDAPDTLVSDSEPISLDPAGHGIRKFYTVPPATFG